MYKNKIMEKILLKKVNDFIGESTKGYSFIRANNGKAKKKFHLCLNPYIKMTDCGLTALDLKRGDKLKDSSGIIIKVLSSGGAGLFGKDNFSWIWITFNCVNSTFNASV